MARLNDWNTTLIIEKKWNNTHIYLSDRDNEIHLELDKNKLEQLIKILEACK